MSVCGCLMVRRPPRSTRADTRVPYTTRVRSRFTYLLFTTGLVFLCSCGNNNPKDAGDYQESKSCIEKELELSDRKAKRIRRRIHAEAKAASIDSIFRIKRKEGFNGNVLIAQQGVKIDRKSTCLNSSH